MLALWRNRYNFLLLRLTTLERGREPFLGYLFHPCRVHVTLGPTGTRHLFRLARLYLCVLFRLSGIRLLCLLVLLKDLSRLQTGFACCLVLLDDVKPS